MTRYTGEIVGRSKNPLYFAVARELGDAIYLERGTPQVYPRYRNRHEQAVLLERTFKKYVRVGNVWTAAAAKVCM